MTEARFTEADLEPSDQEKRAARRDLLDRLAASGAVVAVGVWIGGMIALGACAAPAVFRHSPAPFSGNAMGAAFARFDRVALGAAAVALGCEGVRTWLARRAGASAAARVRRLAAMIMAASAAYVGLAITPRVSALHLGGAARGAGPEGEELDRIHAQAETLGKVTVALGVLVAGLHVLTVRGRRGFEDDEEEQSSGPLAPGPLPPGRR